MTEFNEPLWVGMDIDAEHARYMEEDRLRDEALAVAAGAPSQAPKGSPLGRALRAAVPAMGRGGVPRLPLSA